MARLLLVEDDTSIAEPLIAALRREGHDVDWSSTGEKGLASAGPGVDLVLLDLGLPDLDGMQVYKQIAARWPDLPVLFSTGHGDQNLLTNTPNGKKVGYLQKPYESDTLLAALDELLG